MSFYFILRESFKKKMPNIYFFFKKLMIWQDTVYFLKLANKFSRPGIIMVGANVGDESLLYNFFRITNVIFIEADPIIFYSINRRFTC